MKSEDLSFLIDIIVRYSLIFLIGLGNLYLFYSIFTPLTINTLYLILKSVTDVILINNFLLVNNVLFEVVSACVGGFAYYLLFILLVSTRDIKFFLRIKILLFLYLILFTFNILRILFMMYLYGFVYFDTIHWFFWYFISTIFVFILWIVSIKIFNINEIPVYSDLVFILQSFKNKKDKNIKKRTKKNSKKRKLKDKR